MKQRGDISKSKKKLITASRNKLLLLLGNDVVSNGRGLMLDDILGRDWLEASTSTTMQGLKYNFHFPL